MAKQETKDQELVVPQPEEPKSAHATPKVEEYVEDRKGKAEEQIEKEN